MQMSCHEAVKLNNKGVVELRANCLREAANSFHAALSMVVRSLHADKGKTDFKSGESFLDTSILAQDGLPMKSSITFNSPLVIQSKEGIYSVKETSMISAAVIYNLSLGYHLFGLRLKNTSYLKRSSKLYVKAITILKNEARHYNSTILPLYVGILNNYRDIQRELGIAEDELNSRVLKFWDEFVNMIPRGANSPMLHIVRELLLTNKNSAPAA